MFAKNSQPFFKEMNSTTLHQPISVQVPGKLYLAGEYSVLHPGQAAILMAVDRYLTCTVSPSNTKGQGHLETSLSGLKAQDYQRDELGRIQLTGEQAQWQFVLAAIQIVEKLLGEIEQPSHDFNLSLTSQLVAEDGQKYGLGSSGAVTVASLQALLEFHGLHCQSPLVLYQLAAMAIQLTDSKSSLGDVATNCLGGLVYYQSLNRDWLADIMAQPDWSIMSLLEQDWPRLVIKNLPALSQGQFLIGWSKTPASSDSLVSNLNQGILEDPDYYNDFLRQAQTLVFDLKEAFLEDDLSAVQEGINQYRNLLLDLSQHFFHLIETPALTDLVHLAQARGYAAKSSGAGGGDCGIALGANDAHALYQDWRQHAIEPLNLKIAPHRF